MLVTVVKETSKTLQATALVLGCPPDMKGKSLWQRHYALQNHGPEAPDLELA